ncbi:MAG: thioredoxin family protein [Flavobacterium sp.]
MIKKIFLILFLVLNVEAFSQQTLFLDKKYDESLALAKTENKPLILMFYAKWCPHCNTMKKEVFTDKDVVEFYGKNYICAAIDAESDYGKEIRAKFDSKFKVSSYPTFAVLDSNEALLYCNSGEFKKDRFISEGKEILQPENQLPNIKKAFDADISNPDKCLKYITSLRKAGFDATPIAQKYLKTVKPEDKLTETNWRIFSNGINNFDTDEFRFIIQNKEAFAKAASPSRVDKKIAYTISETMKPLVDKIDTINYDKKRLVAESFKNRKIDSLLYRFDLQIVSQTTNWKKYQKITIDNVEKFSWNDYNTLYDICNTYYETVNDKKGLLLAVEWSKHLLAAGESIDKYIVTTKLLMKLKDYKQALVYAQKGKAIVDAMGFKNDQLNGLLEEIKKHT